MDNIFNRRFPYRDAAMREETPEQTINRLGDKTEELTVEVDKVFGRLLMALVALVIATGLAGFFAYNWRGAEAVIRETTLLSDPKAPCRDVLAVVPGDGAVGLCPHSEHSLDTAWMGGNRALCRCTKR